MPLDKLDSDMDILVSGPPTPPWFGNGNKQGLGDARAAVFIRVLEWVVLWIKSGCLIAAVLENILGVLQNVGGKSHEIK